MNLYYENNNSDFNQVEQNMSYNPSILFINQKCEISFGLPASWDFPPVSLVSKNHDF